MALNKSSIAGLLIAVTIGLVVTWRHKAGNTDDVSSVAVTLPAQLSVGAQEGKTLFEGNCAVCHGKYAAGTNQGPPLIHIIYETSHHGDGSFYRAVQNGVRQHHWPFGNMPSLPDVRRSDVTRIISYVRELQRANGIK